MLMDPHRLKSVLLERRVPRDAGLVTGDCVFREPPVTSHKSPVTHQYPLGLASASMKLPLRGESFHTWNPVSK
jgi:hypothetical protein